MGDLLKGGDETDEDVIKDSLREEIRRVLKSLSPREAEIVNAYFGLDGENGVTIEQIGIKYDLTDGGTLANGWKLNIFTSGRIAAVTDVGVSITSSPEPVTVGQNLTYTLHVVNNGPADAAGVVAHQVLPAGVTFVSASAGATVADGTVTVTLPSLAVGASSDYQIVVKPTAAGPLASTASVTTTLQDVYAPNDAASLTATAVVPSVAAPLGIRRDGSSIILSWPQNGSGVLETTSGLTPGVWTSVPDAPQVSGGLKTVTLQPSGVIRFYRLRN